MTIFTFFSVGETFYSDKLLARTVLHTRLREKYCCFCGIPKANCGVTFSPQYRLLICQPNKKVSYFTFSL